MSQSSMPGMTVVREAGVCVVALTGRIDSTNANDVMTRLTALISGGEKSVVIDLSGVRYLTSAAFRALLITERHAERVSARFALCGVGSHVRDLFEIAGMLTSFTIHPSRQEAIAQGAPGE